MVMSRSSRSLKTTIRGYFLSQLPEAPKFYYDHNKTIMKFLHLPNECIVSLTKEVLILNPTQEEINLVTEAFKSPVQFTKCGNI